MKIEFDFQVEKPVLTLTPESAEEIEALKKLNASPSGWSLQMNPPEQLTDEG